MFVISNIAYADNNEDKEYETESIKDEKNDNYKQSDTSDKKKSSSNAKQTSNTNESQVLLLLGAIFCIASISAVTLSILYKSYLLRRTGTLPILYYGKREGSLNE